MTSEHCTVVIRSQGDDPKIYSAFGIQDRCRLAVGQLDGVGSHDAIVMVAKPGLSFIYDIRGFAQPSYHLVAGDFDDLVLLDLEDDGLGELLLFGPGAPTLIRADGGGLQCQAALPELPAATRVVAGDLDGDGKQELVLLNSRGEARMFTQG